MDLCPCFQTLSARWVLPPLGAASQHLGGPQAFLGLSWGITFLGVRHLVRGIRSLIVRGAGCEKEEDGRKQVSRSPRVQLLQPRSPHAGQAYLLRIKGGKVFVAMQVMFFPVFTMKSLYRK